MNIEELKALIDTYHEAGKSRDDTVAIVSALPINGEASTAFEYVDTVYKATGKGLGEFNLTDAGNAEYFISLYGENLRYDHSRGRWLRWVKHYWKPDTDKGITRLAVKSAREHYKNAVNIADLELRGRVAKWAIQSEGKARLEALVSLAKDFHPIADSGEHWDTNPWLFCVANGVVDLRTGELRDGKQSDMITMQSPVTYDKEAKCPIWLNFIEQVVMGNAEVNDYLQRAVGYSLTGETRSQLWFFLYGLGSNGKSTFTMTVRRMVGDYGVRLDSDDLMIRDKQARGSNPKEGVADTRGKRFAVASEVQDGKRLDIGLLKDMAGQDTIKARRLYEHEVEFMPTHKLWMFGNHKPVITDTTHAAWRRLKLIPFNFTVPDGAIDPDLQSKLEGELPGILNWAIEGCLKWQADGFNEPVIVTDAVAAYRHDSDILADFIEDCCTLEPLATVTKSELKELYDNWCKDNGQEPITRNTFKKRLIEKGIGEGRAGNIGRFWTGIRVKVDGDNGDKSDKTNPDFVPKVTKLSNFPTKSSHEEKKLNTLWKVTKVSSLMPNDLPPEFPSKPCFCGNSDFWLREQKGQPVEWVCCRCHPQPKEGKNAST